tara:strand:- start:196 stop:426 length:231 start_codon:yes stop_codon:yes gene_type:complete
MNKYQPQYKSTITGEWCNFTDLRPTIIEADNAIRAIDSLSKSMVSKRKKVSKNTREYLHNKVRLVDINGNQKGLEI